MKTIFFKILFLVSLFFISCSSDDSNTDDNPDSEEETEALYFPPLTSDTWETTSIIDLGWNADAEQPLYDLLEEKGTKAFIILKNGKIVIEEYFNGATVTDNNPWNSAGKTLTAFTIGLAHQEGFLDINNPSSMYLGNGWSTITEAQETAITVRNHLTMTTGLDYNVTNQNCTDTSCLTYLNTQGSFWYYHNAGYTLLTNMVTGATDQSYADYFESRLKNKIGMTGSWINIGFNTIYFSNARSMARFGLLNLNKGKWDTTEILSDQDYFNSMTTTSQNENKAYGYLWWLNGKDSFRSPGSQLQFTGKLILNAPDDLYAGLGKNDQKLYIIPSQNLVIVRMGDDAGEALLGPSSFDNDLWEKINALIN